MLKGSLFTREFLSEGIIEYEEWKQIPETTLEEFQQNLLKTFAKFPT